MNNDLLSKIKSKALVVRVMPTKDDSEFTGIYDYEATKEAYNIIYASAESPWIPVTPETMPEDGKQVLIYSALTKKVGVSDVVSELVKYPQGYFTVTHWMPLPALPEQEGANSNG